MKLTVIISLITAISAILAPLLTAIINNKHLLKIKQIEVIYEKHNNVIENYILNGTKYAEHCGVQYREEFFKYSNLIYSCVPKSLWTLIDMLNTSIQDKDTALASKLLAELGKELSKSLFQTSSLKTVKNK